uniref:Uncharacterized protein n=1 Tax=Opuntia streptacantha TaxID=393608 RepID=A0A7C9D3S3_OPUST
MGFITLSTRSKILVKAVGTSILQSGWPTMAGIIGFTQLPDSLWKKRQINMAQRSRGLCNHSDLAEGRTDSFQCINIARMNSSNELPGLLSKQRAGRLDLNTACCRLASPFIIRCPPRILSVLSA